MTARSSKRHRSKRGPSLGRRALALSVLASCGTLLALPAAGSAATEFGSDLTLPVNGVTNCGPPGGCTLFNSAVHTGNAGSAASPVGGVVSRLILNKSTGGSPSWQTLEAHAVHMVGPSSFSRFAPSSAIHPTDSSGLESFSVRFPINAGDYVGLSGSGNFYSVGSAPGALLQSSYPNPLNPNGTPGAAGPFTNIELFLRAVVEPDADRDGYGDETQDLCSSQPTTQGVCSNAFSFGKLKRNKKKGTATLIVNVPGPGTLTASGKGVRAASAGQAVTSKTVGAAGGVKLVIRAKGKQAKTLRKTGKVKLKTKITYTPTGGGSASRSTKLKLQLKRKKR